MKTLFIAISLLTSIFPSPAAAPKQEFYAIRIYQLNSAEQESRVDDYLQHAFVPALHRQGIHDVGVFKPVGNDTAAIRRIYVLIPFKSLEQFAGLNSALAKDQQYGAGGLDYQNARPKYLESVLGKLLNWEFASENMSKKALRAAAE